MDLDPDSDFLFKFVTPLVSRGTVCITNFNFNKPIMCATIVCQHNNPNTDELVCL